MVSINRVIIFLLTGIISAISQADVIDDILKRGELRVAIQTQGPPISFINKKGERSGFAIDIIQSMAKDMGVELKLLDYDWKGLIPAVRSGKADFLAADMTPSPQRALVLNFTDPYLYSDVVFYSRGDQDFTTWQSVCDAGAKVGAVQGSSHVQVVKKRCPNADLKQFAGGGAALAQALAAKRIDAAVNELASVNAFLVDYPNFKLLKGALASGPLSFALRPEDQHLLRWLNNYFIIMKADGRMDELADYWMRSGDWKKDH